MKKKIIIAVFLVLLFGAGILVYLGQREKREKELFYSGTIEATEADLSFQVSGRVSVIYADEGQAVQEGQVLAEIDKTEFDSKVEAARANLELAQIHFSQAKLSQEISKKTLPLEVKRAEAGVEALKAKVDQLQTGFRKQEIEQVRLSLSALQATLEESEKNKQRYEALFQKGIVSEKEYDLISLKNQTTLKEYERVKEQVDMLEEGFRVEDIRSIQAQLAEREAILRQARANLRQIEMRQQEMESALARVRAAEANLKLAQIQRQYTELKAPRDGIITTRNITPGEVVVPTRIALTLADLSVVDLKIFVDVTDMGHVKPDQKVEVKVDTFPDKSFWGRVAYISPQAEFTPKIIQTHKERVKLVYLVKIRIPNPDLELKSGMPADAWLIDGGQRKKVKG